MLTASFFLLGLCGSSNSKISFWDLPSRPRVVLHLWAESRRDLHLYREGDRGKRGRGEECVMEKGRIDIEACSASQLPVETPFTVGSHDCIGCAQMCGLASEKSEVPVYDPWERELNALIVAAPAFFPLSSLFLKPPSAQVLHAERADLLAAQWTLREELQVTGSRNRIYPIWLCLKCGNFFLRWEKNKQGQELTSAGYISSLKSSWITSSVKGKC